MPRPVEAVNGMRGRDRERLRGVLQRYDNAGFLADAVGHIAAGPMQLASPLART
ncbi:MAG: hypothetical protein RXQ56_08425 [Thermoproteus sp.]